MAFTQHINFITLSSQEHVLVYANAKIGNTPSSGSGADTSNSVGAGGSSSSGSDMARMEGTGSAGTDGGLGSTNGSSSSCAGMGGLVMPVYNMGYRFAPNELRDFIIRLRVTNNLVPHLKHLLSPEVSWL